MARRMSLSQKVEELILRHQTYERSWTEYKTSQGHGTGQWYRNGAGKAKTYNESSSMINKHRKETADKIIALVQGESNVVKVAD
jgi:hypothetical protein